MLDEDKAIVEERRDSNMAGTMPFVYPQAFIYRPREALHASGAHRQLVSVPLISPSCRQAQVDTTRRGFDSFQGCFQ